jgi:prepilin-type N-terminal cleavage/methylation domain-containing protein
MNNQKGMTIIETMFAIVIFGMGLLAAVQLHYSTARNNGNGNVLTLCQMAAKETLEQIRMTNISDLEEGTFTKKIGLVDVTYTISKSPTNLRFGTAMVVASLKNKRVSGSTNINNSWGHQTGVTATPGSF